jgi:hypothetical protein
MTTKETWKPVTIGGLTGILMGAGTMFGIQATASVGNEEPMSANEGFKVATVDDSMSFNHAFESARAQVGAGGVFTWRGNIFNTYTADEWKAMSNDEKRLFAEQVKPEIPAADVDTKQIAENTSAEPDSQDLEVGDDVQIVAEQQHNTEVNNNYEAQLQATSWNQLAQEENDVRVVGFKDIEIGKGRSITMQEVDINGQRVAVIDVDKDGDPDFAMTDLNHNYQMDEGEVIDLHTGEAVSFTNDDPAVDNTPDFDTFTT